MASAEKMKMPLYADLLAKSRDFVHGQLDMPDELPKETAGDLRTTISNASGRLIVSLYNELHGGFHFVHGEAYEQMGRVDQAKNKSNHVPCDLGVGAVHGYFQVLINNSQRASDDEEFLYGLFHSEREVVNG